MSDTHHFDAVDPMLDVVIEYSATEDMFFINGRKVSGEFMRSICHLVNDPELLLKALKERGATFLYVGGNRV